MPRLSNALPSYRKHRASGQAICTIAGRDHYLGSHGTKASKLEYDRLIGEWLSAGRPNSIATADNLTVSELILRYWRHAQQRYVKNGEPTTELHLVQMALKPVREIYGRTAVADFGPLALKAVRSQLIAKDWSRKVINDAVMRIRRMFRWGVAEQLVEPHILEALRAVEGLRKGSGQARETAPVQPVSQDAIEAALEYLPSVVGDMVRLQLLTGCRPAEVCLMRPCDIDRTGEVWQYRPESHKTEHHGRARVIHLGPKSQSILLRYLARDAQAYCFRPCDSEKKRRATSSANRKTPVSCGNVPGSNRKKAPKRRAGEKYDTHSYRRAIHRACDKAFPHPELGYVLKSNFTDEQSAALREWQPKFRWSPNQLRHTAATEIRREFGLEAAQVILGHSQANVTQVYAERDLTKGMEVARQIG